MSKNIKVKFLSVILGGVISLSVCFGITDTADIIDLPTGVHAEEIEGMIHQVEYHYGNPLYYDLNSMLSNKSIAIYPEDRLGFFPDPALGIGSQIVIKRANQVAVNDAGIEKTYRTWTNKVGDFLSEKNIPIGENDLINLAKDQNFSQLLAINDRSVVARDSREKSSPVVAEIAITRVAITEIKGKEDIGFKTITKEDASLERGVTRIEQEGKKGVKEFTYEVRRENGVEVNRKLLKTEITREPIDKIVIKGTKVVVYGNGGATWYGLIGGMTAAHNSLPKGTMVHVVNLANGKSVNVKIVDRGIQGSAIIDLSADAFRQLAPLGQGVIQVRLEKM